SAAANEAGQSRIWAGIHWAFDVTAGNAQGAAVATYVFQNFLLPRTSPPGGSGRSPPFLVKPDGRVGEATINNPELQPVQATPVVLIPSDASLPGTAGNPVISDAHAVGSSAARSAEGQAPTWGTSVDDVFGPIH